MVQLKVMIVGTSPAETMRLEDALHQTGYLDMFRYIGLEQAMDHVPDWDEWDLLMARYQERTGSNLLSLLASVLRNAYPPVIFLVDSYDPLLVTQLLNVGGKRVLSMDVVEQMIEPGLAAVIQPDMIRGGGSLAAAKQPGKPSNGAVSLAETEGVFPQLFRTSPIGLSIHRLRDGKCVDCNESFAELLEWRREDLLGQDLLELGLTDDIKKCFEVDRQDIIGQLYPLQYERKI